MRQRIHCFSRYCQLSCEIPHLHHVCKPVLSVTSLPLFLILPSYIHIFSLLSLSIFLSLLPQSSPLLPSQRLFKCVLNRRRARAHAMHHTLHLIPIPTTGFSLVFFLCQFSPSDSPFLSRSLSLSVNVLFPPLFHHTE